MTCGFFNSQTPAYFFKDSGVNTYYWYSNRLPSMDEYKVAGEWSNIYISNYSRINVEWDTRTIPFFYGKHSYDNVIYSKEIPSKWEYIMSNPSIPYKNKISEKNDFNQDSNAIYFNGELKTYNHKID